MKPLLRRSNLLPGESLPSLLERLSLLNYYNTGTIGWLCHSNESNQCRINITQPNSAQAFFQLAQLTLISPEDLLAASKHFFAPLLYSSKNTKTFMRWFDGKNIQLLNIAYRKIRPSHAAQFCPICLKNSPYHRLAWMPISSAICLQHKCLLLDQCPTCLKNITVAEIVAHQCKACKTDLAQIPPASAIDYNELGILSQRVIQSWLSLVPAPSLPINHTLPESSAVMHLLWERLRMSLLTCQVDWNSLQTPLAGLHLYIPKTLNLRKKLPPKYAYYLYSKTFAGILNWPQGFYDFLDAYGQRNFNVFWSRNIRVRLGSLGQWFCKILGQPEFMSLHPVLQEYISARYLSLPISCQALNNI